MSVKGRQGLIQNMSRVSKNLGSMLGVLVIRIRVYWDLFLDPLFLETPIFSPGGKVLQQAAMARAFCADAYANHSARGLAVSVLRDAQPQEPALPGAAFQQR